MTGVKLNFINQSNDTNNSEIVIFQKNAATNFDELAVAWKVIKYCGQGMNHPFSFPIQNYVSASDSWGNYSPQLAAQNGQLFSVEQSPSGNILKNAGSATSSKEMQILNGLHTGAINANIYKDGRLLATKTGVAPQQKVAFEFNPTLWIGAVSQILEGSLINSAIISQVNTELSLLGIASADIVMTGGGPGKASTGFNFTLQNIVYA
ncbi:hypothetical protein [Mucilaginibacter sp. OK098]|uniref:hypothetical protein n=1 Tax=Mucilaginibacter sp. OK098 TaxID=1855297 RepID=UPI0009200A27|nr:hypothetical protein [Mucilaginibacter sp. OK098]SHN21539.1 hypothetical protein SAMN05216524_106525 [Mucilaginibacter sp. OK098]